MSDSFVLVVCVFRRAVAGEHILRANIPRSLKKDQVDAN